MFEDAIREIDDAHAGVGAAERRLLAAVLRVDRVEAWKDDGARDLVHWLWMRYGISYWKAQRWIVAAHVLEGLPLTSRALSSGELGLDKVLELCRFARPQTEAKLIGWAQEVSCAQVRRRADAEVRKSREETIDAERARRLEWWWQDDRFGLQAELPAAQGAVVVRALERMTERIPVMPGEDGPWDVEARRADALVALCSAQVASDPDADRATVVVHARLEQLDANAELEDGPALAPETLARLLCTARTQIVVEDGADVVSIRSLRRDPPAWMVRQLRHRDRGCRFPGCGSKGFTQAHHVRWHSLGGRTELSNLLLVCSFHHRLVHEHGWRIDLERDGTVHWLKPSGVRYRAGPSPWLDVEEPMPMTSVG